ncbi:MAG: nickel-responsive transcriptional regulator NikR [PVC group bacterium]|nr:nickel-responsive transcriptional regulator NikR [PVC group bacterium]
MSKLVRFGVSLEQELLTKFDRLIKARNYTNRSEAIRDLIREELVEREWQTSGEIAGAITIVYDHHCRDLGNKLTDIQHDFLNIIISTQHLHLDHHNCLEILAIKGSAKKAQKLANILQSVKGVKHATLSMTGTGKI